MVSWLIVYKECIHKNLDRGNHRLAYLNMLIQLQILNLEGTVVKVYPDIMYTLYNRLFASDTKIYLILYRQRGIFYQLLLLVHERPVQFTLMLKQHLEYQVFTVDT